MGGLFSKFRRGSQRETGNGGQSEQSTLSRSHQSEPQLIDEPQGGAYKTDTLRSTKSEGGLLRGKKQHGKKEKGSSSTLDKSDDHQRPECQKAGVTTSSSSRSSTLDRNAKSVSLPKGASLRGLFRSKSSTLKSTRSGGSKDSLDKRSKSQQQAPSDGAQGNFLTRLLRRSSRELRKKDKEPAKQQRSRSEEKELLTTAQSEQQNQEIDDSLVKLRASSEEPQTKAAGLTSETPLLDTLQQGAAFQHQDNADIIQERSLALKQTLSRSQELILEHQEKRKQFLMTKTITTTRSKETEADSTVSQKREETKLESKIITAEDHDYTEEIIFEQKKHDDVNKKAGTEKQDTDLEDSYEIIDGQEVAISQQAGSELKADLERLQWEAQKIRGSDEALKPACDEFEILQVRQNEKIDDKRFMQDREESENVVEDAQKTASKMELSEDDKTSSPENVSTEKIDQTELFISEDVTSEEKRIPNLEEQEPSLLSFEERSEHPEMSVNTADLPNAVTQSHEETMSVVIREKESPHENVPKDISSELDSTESSHHLSEAETETKLEDAHQDLALLDTNKMDNTGSLKADDAVAVISKEDLVSTDDESIKLKEGHFLEFGDIHAAEMEPETLGAVEHDHTESKASDSENAEQFGGEYTKTGVEMGKMGDFEEISTSGVSLGEMEEDEHIVSAVEASGSEVQGTMLEMEVNVAERISQNKDLEQPQAILEESITTVSQSISTEHEGLPADVGASTNKTSPVSDTFVDENEVIMESNLGEMIQNVTENKTDLEELSTQVSVATVEEAEQQGHDLEEELLVKKELTKEYTELLTDTDDHISSLVKCESQTEAEAKESQTSDIQMEINLVELIPESDAKIPNLGEQSNLEVTREAFQTVDEDIKQGLDTVKLAENQSVLESETEEHVTPADKYTDQMEATLQGEKLESPKSQVSSDVQMDSSLNELIQNSEDQLESHELSGQADNSSVDAHETKEVNLEQVSFNTSQLNKDISVLDAETVGDVPFIAQPVGKTEETLQEEPSQSPLDDSSKAQTVETTSATEVPEDTTAMLQQVVSDAYSKAIDELKSTLIKEEEQVPAEGETTHDFQDLLQKHGAEDAMHPVQDRSQTIATCNTLPHEEYEPASGKEIENEEESRESHEQSEVQKEGPIPVSPFLPVNQSFNLDDKTYQETVPSEIDTFRKEAFDDGTLENTQVDDVTVENQQTLSELSPVEQDKQWKPVDYSDISLEAREEVTADGTIREEDVLHSVSTGEAVVSGGDTDLQDVTNAEKQEDGGTQPTLPQTVTEEKSAKLESVEHSEVLDVESSKQEQIVQCAEKSSCLPHEFIWDHGGQDVYLCASFNNWMPIPLSKSDGVHKVTLDVPEGKHYYRYIVDEEATVNRSQAVEGDLNAIELKLAD